jgi:hypothetical protein
VNAGAVRLAERGKFGAAAAALGAASYGLGAPAAQAAARADYAAAARGIVGSLDLQTAFPNPAVAIDPSFSFSDFGLVRVLIWAAVAIGVVVVALYLRDILPGGGLARRRGWNAAEDQPGAAAAGAESAAQSNADELARLGRFVEAMHVLLLQALADMRRRLDLRIADSLTSREIVNRASVSPAARSALQEIVGAVERAYFGDHPAGEPEYRACRTQFAAFVGALREGRPA